MIAKITFPPLLALAQLFTTAGATEVGPCARLLTSDVRVEAVHNHVRLLSSSGAQLTISTLPTSRLVEVTEPAPLSRPYTKENVITVKDGTWLTVIGHDKGVFRILNRIDLQSFTDESTLSSVKNNSILATGENFDVLGYTIESEADRVTHYIPIQLVIRTRRAVHLLTVSSAYFLGFSNGYRNTTNIKLSSLEFDAEIDRVGAPWEMETENAWGRKQILTVFRVFTKDGGEHLIHRVPMQTLRQGWSPDPAHLVEIAE